MAAALTALRRIIFPGIATLPANAAIAREDIIPQYVRGGGGQEETMLQIPSLCLILMRPPSAQQQPLAPCAQHKAR